VFMANTPAEVTIRVKVTKKGTNFFIIPVFSFLQAGRQKVLTAMPQSSPFAYEFATYFFIRL